MNKSTKMKIYTKTGDAGLTSLIGGVRVSKADIRLDAYGTVDELNSYIGLIRDQEITSAQKDALMQVQEHLFIMGALLAADNEKSRMKLPGLYPADIEQLEHGIDAMQQELAPLKNFILPGGSTLISFCHIARCVCRRAERIIVHLSQDSAVEDLIMIYLNRLSDYLFVLARKVAMDNQIPENKWFPR